MCKQTYEIGIIYKNVQHFQVKDETVEKGNQIWHTDTHTSYIHMYTHMEVVGWMGRDFSISEMQNTNNDRYELGGQ